MFSTYYIDNAHVLSFINSYCFSLLNIIVLARKCVKRNRRWEANGRISPYSFGRVVLQLFTPYIENGHELL